MLYLLVVLVLGTLIYLGWRAARSQTQPRKNRALSGLTTIRNSCGDWADNKPR